MTEPTSPFRVNAIVYEAREVLSFVLAPVDGRPLPPVEAGSHIDMHLGNGMMRSYSLSNSDEGQLGFRVTVARDADSKGGSVYLHQSVRPGDVIEVSAPRNHFPLCETGGKAVFIAGGIGITPFVPMAARLNAIGKPWRLHYLVRTRDRASLLPELEALAAQGKGEVIPNFDEEPGGVMLDLDRVITALGSDQHIYCCGPIGLLDAFRSSCSKHGVESERVHFEYFSSAIESATDGGYDLILARKGVTVRVDEGQTPLKALLAAGVDVPYSCEDGVCGACETRVLDGVPDHRDMILTDQERTANRSMMVCCSGAKTPSLTLDL